MQSPVKSFRSLHASFVAEKLRAITDDIQHVQEKRRPSRLSLIVNDSQASGAQFHFCYEQEELLGEGGFAMVYRCRHKINESQYAVKEVFHDDYQDGANSLKEEIAAMKSLRESPYIVRLHDVFYEKDKTYLVMEEMKGGDLLDKITEKKTYNERDAKKISVQLLDAIRFCHKKRIAHRDIKLENILLVHAEDDTTIKLCDFGCARTVTGSHCFKTMAGSPQYAAPEVFDHEDKGGYDQQCDLWSVGVVIYVLLCGYAPFEGSLVDLSRLICSGDWVFHKKHWIHVSEKTKELIRSLLQVNPEIRLTADEALDSAWLRRPELNRHRSVSDKALSSEKETIDQKLYQSMRVLDTKPLFDPESPLASAPTEPLLEPFQKSPMKWLPRTVEHLKPLAPFQKSPMKWIGKSPIVARIRREMTVQVRRQKAKQKLGDSLRSLASNQTGDGNLDVSESSKTAATVFNTSMGSVYGLPTIPVLELETDDDSLNPDDVL